MAFTGITTTFRTIGNTAATHNLFTIWNGDSVAIVTIRRVMYQMDTTAVLTAVTGQVKSSRISAAPTGGTVLTKGSFDSTQTSNVNVVCMGATASDGGGATAITATAVTTLWQEYCTRLHTAVGQVLEIDMNVMPDITEDTSGSAFKLKQNEGLLVHLVGAATTNNPITNHWFVNCMWEESP